MVIETRYDECSILNNSKLNVYWETSKNLNNSEVYTFGDTLQSMQSSPRERK